jgi:DNA-binding NtrC family response regulator
VVLLVDDDPHVLSALRRGLRREHVTIQTARNAREALDRLAEGAIALVISDQRMPGMSGTALLTRIRAGWPSTRRILLSGWTDEIPPTELKAADLYELLPKPWDDTKLRRAIRGAVGLSED